MKKRYDHQYNGLQESSRRYARRGAATFVVVIALLVVGFVFYDLLFNGFNVVDDPGSSTVGFVEGTARDQVVFDEPTFSFKAPKGWEEVSRDELPIYTTISYQNQEAGKTARQLKLYIDTMPSRPVHQKTTKVAAVSTNSERTIVQLVRISPQCYLFTDGAEYIDETVTPDPVKATWQDAEFLCNADRLIQSVGTSTAGGSTGFVLKGQNYQHRFHMVYTDHTTEPDFDVFDEMIYSLRVK